jgi:glycosyltransferase involved in cell wall biosynthesis
MRSAAQPMNRKPHLLVVAQQYDKSEHAICIGLAGCGFTITMLCDPSAHGQDMLQANGIQVESFKVKHRLDLSAMRRLRQTLQSLRPDVIYAPTNSTLSVTLLAARGLKIPVIAYRGTSGHLSRFDPASWLTYLNPSLDMIVCVSNAVRSYLRSMGVAEKKLVTIYKGHDPDWYSRLHVPDRSTFNIPAEAVIVGFVGNMRPVKGVPVLLRAFALLPEDLHVHLLIAGEIRDPEINRLMKTMPGQDRIHFTGYCRNGAEIAGACDIFVMPSLTREGLPRAVIEAMAQKVPPIVSNVGGMPELIEDNISGLVVPPGDPGALASAIARLARDPALRLSIGGQARQRIASSFNISETVKKYEATCLALIKNT